MLLIFIATSILLPLVDFFTDVQVRIEFVQHIHIFMYSAAVVVVVVIVVTLPH